MYVVTLTNDELEDMLDVVMVIRELKAHGEAGVRIKEEKLKEFEEVWLTSILEKIKSNEFPVNSTDRNVFKWLADQVKYTGLDKPMYIKAQRILKLAEAAGSGEYNWLRYRNRASVDPAHFSTLFR